jgi:polygalacturonase
MATTINVKDFGAVGDGVRDETAAFCAAVDCAFQERASLLIPAGRYHFDGAAPFPLRQADDSTAEAPEQD